MGFLKEHIYCLVEMGITNVSTKWQNYSEGKGKRLELWNPGQSLNLYGRGSKNKANTETVSGKSEYLQHLDSYHKYLAPEDSGLFKGIQILNFKKCSRKRCPWGRWNPGIQRLSEVPLSPPTHTFLISEEAGKISMHPSLCGKSGLEVKNSYLRP